MIAYTFMDAYSDLHLGKEVENRIIYNKDTVKRNVDRDEELKKIREYAILIMAYALILDEMRSLKGSSKDSALYKDIYSYLVRIFNDTFRALKISKSFSSAIDYQFTKEDMRTLRGLLEEILGEKFKSRFPYHKLDEMHVTIKYKLYLQLLDNTLFGDITHSNTNHVYIQDLLDKYDSLFIKL